MSRVFKDPVGWAEKAVGTTPRFVFVCVATLGFWGLAMIGMHLAVRASVLHAVAGAPMSLAHRGVWLLVYAITFAGTVGFPLLYLVALQGLLIVVRTERQKKKGGPAR